MKNDHAFCRGCGHEHLVNARTHEIGPCPICAAECKRFKPLKRGESAAARVVVDDDYEAIRQTVADLARLAAGLVLHIVRMRQKRGTPAPPMPKANGVTPFPPDLTRALFGGMNGANLHAEIAPPKNEIGPGVFRVLQVMAQYPKGATRAQLKLYAEKSTRTITDYVGILRRVGYAEPKGLRATPAGIAFLGAHHIPLPTGAALVAHWRATLPVGEASLFDLLLRAHPEPLDRDTMSRLTKLSTRTITDYLGKLRSRQIVRGKGTGLSLAPELFREERAS